MAHCGHFHLDFDAELAHVAQDPLEVPRGVAEALALEGYPLVEPLPVRPAEPGHGAQQLAEVHPLGAETAAGRDPKDGAA